MASVFAACVDCGAGVRVQLPENTPELFRYGSGAPSFAVPEGSVVRCETDAREFVRAQMKAKAEAEKTVEKKR